MFIYAGLALNLFSQLSIKGFSSTTQMMAKAIFLPALRSLFVIFTMNLSGDTQKSLVPYKKQNFYLFILYNFYYRFFKKKIKLMFFKRKLLSLLEVVLKEVTC